MKKLGLIKKELVKLYGKEKTSDIVKRAEYHYDACLSLCRHASKGEFIHLENTLLPAVSFYKALLEIDCEHALTNTRNILIGFCETGGNILNTVLMLPGMDSLFMKLLPKMAVKMFGEECGFAYENLIISRTSLQMDMTCCPYLKYAQLFQVMELMPVFCESDYATYGNLSKIAFRRNETLGTGGKKCDFKFMKNGIKD